MKNIILFIMLLVLVGCDNEIQVGDVFEVSPEVHTWVEVLNENPVNQWYRGGGGPVSLSSGDECHLKIGSKVVVLMIDGPMIWFQMSTSRNITGTACPMGTVFKLRKDIVRETFNFISR
jgi:hypothetical protein